MRAGIAVAVTVLALLLVWAALVAPNHPRDLNFGGFARLPLELLVVVAVAALLPATPRRVLAGVLGAILSLLVLVKVLDIGFFTAFDRPFRPLDDPGYLGIGIETLGHAIGGSSANLVVAAAALLILAILALPVLALLRVTRVAAGHRAWALRAAAVLGVVWVALRVVGAPVASSSAATKVVDEVQYVRDALEGREAFTRPLAHDRFGATPGNRLLTGLRGKDVLVVFVESYGRVAIQDSSFSPRIDAALERGDRAAAGRRLLLAQRLPHLADIRRPQLARAFHPAVGGHGQRRVALRPGREEGPPHPDPGVQARRVACGRGHAGEPPGVAGGLDPLPLRPGLRPPQLRLPRPALRPASHARPVHAACAATSRARQASPAAAVRRGRPHLEPRAVDEDSAAHRLGRRRGRLDLRPPPGGGVAGLFGDEERARTAYANSIEYSLNTILSFVARYGDEDLVLVVLGDHQPATVITGEDASHDVPISVIAHDPKVIDQIAGWSWQDGMSPSPRAPVWPMAAFRDRFLTAFGSSP